MAEPIGFVVIEYNQASHQPSIPSYSDLERDLESARGYRDMLADETRKSARAETYRIAEVVLINEEETEQD